MLLSIIVPVHNEAKTLGEVLRRLFALSLGETEKEIIVVNDGSTDATRPALAPFLSRVVYLEHQSRRGKGAAIRAALPRATGELVVVQDGDTEYAPEEIPALLAALRAHPEWAAVYGSRNLARTGRGYSRYILGAWFLTALVNLFFRSKLTDSYTCYKLIRAAALKDLALAGTGFEIEMELTAKLLKRGLGIGEIPISYRPRSFREGKKIRARDGIRGLVVLFRVWRERAGALSSGEPRV